MAAKQPHNQGGICALTGSDLVGALRITGPGSDHHLFKLILAAHCVKVSTRQKTMIAMTGEVFSPGEKVDITEIQSEFT